MRPRSFFAFEGTPQARNAYYASLIFLLVSLLSMPVYAFIAYQSQVWQGWFLVALTLMLALASGGGMLLSQRGKTVEAMGVMIATIIAGGWIGSLLIAGLGTLMAILIPVVSIIFATQSFPSRWLNRALLLVGLAGVIAAFIGLMGGDLQAQIPALQGTAVPILAAAAIVGFGVIVVRQFSRYPFSTKLLMLFLVIVLAAVSAVAATATWLLQNFTTPQAAERTIVLVSLAVILAVGFLSSIAARALTSPVENLTNASSRVASGDLGARAFVETDDEIGILAKTFNEMAAQLQEVFSTLEQRVADRTKALQTSAEVTRRLMAVTSLRQLATEVVEQVKTAFNYYHAHIYFMDEESGHLIMAGGTGEAGAALLARGHKIQMGLGLVGRAAQTNIPVLVPDVSQAEGWLPNPLLPETRSEAAIPISLGDQMLGVLDVQQNAVNGLGEEDVELLQSIAGQVAISLKNIRSFEESRAQAELETMVNLIGQKIQRAASVEETLQTAIRELGQALGASRVRANIQASQESLT